MQCERYAVGGTSLASKVQDLLSTVLPSCSGGSSERRVVDAANDLDNGKYFQLAGAVVK